MKALDISKIQAANTELLAIFSTENGEHLHTWEAHSGGITTETCLLEAVCSTGLVEDGQILHVNVYDDSEEDEVLITSGTLTA